MEENIIYDDELYHHGTKGMKWGIRNYQYKDGSLTPAGRKRYGSLTDAVGAVKAARIKAKRKKQLAKARKIAAEKKAAAEQRAKDVASGKISARDMTPEEIQTRIDKLNLEKKYKQLMQETSPAKPVADAGKEFVKKLVYDAIIPGTSTATKQIVGDMVTKSLKKQLGIKDPVKTPTWDERKKILELVKDDAISDTELKEFRKQGWYKHSDNDEDIILGSEIVNNMLAEDEIYHYGVKGMKWGVRKHGIYKEYNNAFDKVKRLNSKSDKYKAQSEKHLIKGGKRYITETGRAKSEEHIRKANQLAGRSLKYKKKADKLEAKLDKIFDDDNMTKLSKELIEKSKRYLEQGKDDKAKKFKAKADAVDMFIEDNNRLWT